jgi:hypothetical protein
MPRANLVVFAVTALAIAACADDGPPIAREPTPRAVAAARTDRGGALGRRRAEATRPRAECEPGERRSCGSAVPVVGGMSALTMRCRRAPDGEYRFDRSDCATPLVVVFGDEPVTFTSPPGTFSIGPFERTEWVSPRTPWLARDLDGSGCVEGERELFGPNGPAFEELARLDVNNDGRIDREDPAYPSLVLWTDRDQDRRCGAGEIESLAGAGIVAVEVAPRPAPRAPFGSHEGEQASLWYRDGAAVRRGRVVDVYLAPLP